MHYYSTNYNKMMFYKMDMQVLALIFKLILMLGSTTTAHKNCHEKSRYYDENLGDCTDCYNVCGDFASRADCMQSCSGWCKEVMKHPTAENKEDYHFCFHGTPSNTPPPEDDDLVGSGQWESEGEPDLILTDEAAVHVAAPAVAEETVATSSQEETSSEHGGLPAGFVALVIAFALLLAAVLSLTVIIYKQHNLRKQVQGQTALSGKDRAQRLEQTPFNV